MGRSSERSDGYYESITQRNQKASPLLRLPPELRNKIYTYAFEHATLLNTTGFRPGSSKGYQSPHSRIYQDSSRLQLVCRQLLHETSPFIGSYIYLTLRTLEYNRDPGDLDYIARVAGMIPEKSRNRLKTITLTSRKFQHCFEYLEMIFWECEKFPALSRIDVCCEGWARMPSFRRDPIRCGAWAMGVEIYTMSETSDFFEVWTLAVSEGGGAGPRWQKTRQAKTKEVGQAQALDQAVDGDKDDALPQATAKKEVRQRRVPGIKKLLHKLLCARAE